MEIRDEAAIILASKHAYCLLAIHDTVLVGRSTVEKIINGSYGL
jgi:hypothetical protein